MAQSSFDYQFHDGHIADNSADDVFVLPTSFAQQRLWFLDQLEPNSAVYNIPLSLRLTGDLNLRALQQTLDELVRRHETLRTSFTMVDTEPAQVISPAMQLELPLIDLSQFSAEERDAETRREISAQAQQPFDLREAPLVRVRLLRLSAAEHVLIAVLHHIISDGWSMGVLVREVGALYTAFAGEQAAALPELSVQYADYAVWQREQLQGEVLKQELAYWQEQLRGAPPVLELVTDHARPAVQSFRGAREGLRVSGAVTAAVRELSRREGVTLFMTVLTAFGVLLGRYSGQEEVVIGTPIAGRTRAETEGLIGLFVNTLALRLKLEGAASFQQMLQRVREVCLGAYAHQEIPFERLVEELAPERSLSRTPLFQVMMTLESASGEGLELPGLRVEMMGADSLTVKFDLSLTLIEKSDRLEAVMEYNRDLFEAETIKRMLEHLEVLLAGIVADSGRRLRELPLLSSAEKQQIVYQWNETKRAYPAEQCLHELFEEQVARTPAAIAVVYEEERVSYRELNERANQLAHQLRRLGVKAETPVGVLMERSVALVVALLGVLKAGGAYVPLDPEYPEQRLSFMAADAGISWLLTEEKLKERVTVSAEVQRICVAAARAELAGESSENVGSEVGAENLAYVIYTSGSTGRPKGVMISHRAISNRLHWMQQAYELEATEAVLQKTTFSFDVSVWEFFWPLLVGARLVMARPGGQRDGAYLAELMVREGVTTTHFVPSQLGAWLEEAAAVERGGRLQRVICSGEALSYELQERFHGQLSAALHNLYGPTEAAVDVTSWACERGGERAVVPIGRPISNLEIYILDQELGPVPVGVVGELYIGGVGLSRGYLQRAALTAERFVPHPYSSEAGARLYRTGDLARYLVSGEVEYVGRADGQVKVKGHRIELGEVEAALIGYGPISDCAVVAREASDGQKRLVAYVVINAEVTIAISEWRQYLKERLPEYMIPSAFIELEALPLTASGKLDRKALPAPEAQRLQSESEFVAPRTLIEEVLASVWSEVLGTENISIHENFFDLGGDSIRSIQVRARARQRGVDFSIQQLFQHQTVYELARKVNGTSYGALAAQTEPFSLVGEEDLNKLPGELADAYPVSSLQMGMVFHNAYDPAASMYHNVSSFHLRAPLDLELLETALQQLFARHPALRTSFDLTNFSQPMQLVHKAVRIPLLLEDLSHLSPDEQTERMRAWFELERGRSFDVREAPLLRLHVHRRSGETFQFGFTEHHAILDGWSVASMLTELFQSYLSLLEKRELLIPPPAVTFREFVALEQKSLESDECRNYWEQMLSDRTVTKLPRTSSRSDGSQTWQGRRRSQIALSPETSSGLKRLARVAGVPIKSVLLAAHLNVLSLLSNQTDVMTGVISNGRPEELDGDRVLGLFLNTLPFRVKLGGGTWIELARKTFDVERDMLPFRRFPLAELQKLRGRKVLFEAIFNYAHFHVYQSLEGLENVHLLGRNAFSETELPFVTDFGFDSSSTQVEIRLSANALEFSEQLLEAIGGYYVRVLTEMAENPTGRYDEQSFLSESEQYRQLIEWNDTRQKYPSERCIHQLFEEQTELTPELVAVACEGDELSYGELNARANQLARYLRGLGVGAEFLVGILMDRSIEMVVSVLATLKAGGAYVPLDPEYPQQRLSWMLEDSHVGVVLTQAQLAGRVAVDRDLQVIRVDAEWKEISRLSGENIESEVSAENLAYVIYTSGSTGAPKGVQVSHTSLCNLALAQVAAFRLHSGSRVLQFASLSFDASASELFSTWMAGATLVLADGESLLLGAELLRVLREQEVTTVTLPPTVLSVLPVEELDSLKTLVAAGEALAAEVAAKWSVGGRLVINAYGPTETTVCASYGEWRAGAGQVTIGRPLANTEIYILNGQQQPVPVGVPGELYVGGVGLSRGYLHRPALTAERFIPHPFSKEPGARLYRTGDLGRYLEDGRIEYAGRTDEQVKVRGYRIELGEVEASLREHSRISECVVMAREDPDGQRQLVAYVVAVESDATALSGRELREYLKERLPQYMIPSQFVMLEEMPLTTSRKIDRKALPVPETERPQVEIVYIAPRTALERMLVTLWEQTLRVEQIGVHDNFFELGGDSIKGAILINKLQESLKEYVYVVALFDAPTVAELASYLNTHYAEAIARMCDVDSPSKGSGLSPIAPASRHQPLPLSFAQQRLWFLDQLEPYSAAYNIPVALRLNGNLNLSALQKTLDEVVSRHETLRTSFALIDAHPVQVVSPDMRIELPVIDLSHLSVEEREAETRQQVQKQAQQPFDLTQAPLLRVRLLRLSVEEHVLVCVVHHIISDGWSMSVLIREVATLYGAFFNGQLSPLPQLSLQYADYAVWQREWLAGEMLERELEYWREQLRGAPSLLELPTDRPRPAVQTYGGARQHFTITREVSAALKDLSQDEGVTLFMTLLAAFSIVLSRYSGQQEVVVGTPIAGRTRAESESLIGLFINTLALRVSVGDKLTFRELMRRVREVCLGAYGHQEVPFEKLVDELATERSLSHTPLFQVMMILQNAPREMLDLPELRVEMVEADSQTVKFDLSLTLIEKANRVEAVMEYNRDLFEAETIKRMLVHLQALLEAIVADPSGRLSELSVLSSEEQQQILYQWNETKTAYPAAAQCLHEMFEAQVARTPAAIAVVYEEERVSYGELNKRANRLARHLRRLGVKEETLVGVLMERSVEMVVALLATLKAGGAYVPLDPEYPQERVCFMAEDAGVAVILTQERLRDRVTVREQVPVISVDGQWEKIAGQGSENIFSAVSTANLAYVIYTSGSTGRPKGVMISHGAIGNRLLWMQQAYELDSTDTVLQKTTFSFDVSVWEFFWPLLEGARLVMARPGGQRDSAYLVRVIRQEEVTTLHFVPSMLPLFLAEEAVVECRSLRRVICSGEALSYELQERFHERMSAELHNLYGPTEAAVDVTSWACERESKRVVVPIGRPIANIETYVLDRDLQPVPVGVIGELYLGGVGLSRGYLKRADLTAERFVPHPFSREVGARLYGTGDLARYLTKGEIEYVGRVDQQVKVRGHRIELGEVEAALNKHSEVSECVVVARAESGGEKRLVAYVVSQGEGRIAIGEWRQYLKERLPEYMIPAAFVELESLPLTASGKVDRKALPAPEAQRLQVEQKYTGARTGLERMLKELWEQTLGLERIDVHDNFFELGGNSINGAVLINKLQQSLSEYVPVVALFDAPTVAELASYLTTHFPEEVSSLANEGDAYVRLGDENIDRVRQLIVPLAPPAVITQQTAKNPPAIFILSPPRSGSTLLRVMLGGHSKLFAPPELELLGFNTLGERRSALSGRYSFWLEGTLRALMQLHGCTADEAKSLMHHYEDRDLAVKDFYALLQEKLGERRLVDKTPSYALDKETLRRAEVDFEAPLYLHLIRHPQAVINSFAEARLEQVFFRYENNLSGRELAEAVWSISQENIAELLASVSRERQYPIRFEELVKRPEEVIAGVCEFLGLEMEEGMLRPYEERDKRMTNGIHPLSKMLGDVKFHEHRGIEEDAAERWKKGSNGEGDRRAQLSEVTWRIAESLGYQREDSKNNGRSVIGQRVRLPLVNIQSRGSKRPLFCIHPAGGHVICYADLARQLGEEQPLYGLQAPGVNGKQEPLTRVADMAACYLEAIRAVQPQGPYLLAGYSSGGYVVYEMAQELQNKGEEAAMVGIFDIDATPQGDELHEMDDALLLAGVLKYSLSLSVEHMQQLNPEEQLSYVMQLAKKEKILPPNFAVSEAGYFLNTLRSNVKASAEYIARPYDGRITLFRASERNTISDPTLGWGKLAKGGVDLHVIPGNHVTMIAKPNIEVLAQRLKRCLDEAQADGV